MTMIVMTTTMTIDHKVPQAWRLFCIRNTSENIIETGCMI